MALFSKGTAALGGCSALGDAALLLGCRHLGLGQQVLGVDEPAAGLAEALGCLLLAEAVDVGALLAQARGQPREVAVRRDQAEAVEPAAVQQVHGVDHQRDVGGVLARSCRRIAGRDRSRISAESRPRISAAGWRNRRRCAARSLRRTCAISSNSPSAMRGEVLSASISTAKRSGRVSSAIGVSLGASYHTRDWPFARTADRGSTGRCPLLAGPRPGSRPERDLKIAAGDAIFSHR